MLWWCNLRDVPLEGEKPKFKGKLHNDTLLILVPCLILNPLIYEFSFFFTFCVRWIKNHYFSLRNIYKMNIFFHPCWHYFGLLCLIVHFVNTWSKWFYQHLPLHLSLCSIPLQEFCYLSMFLYVSSPPWCSSYVKAQIPGVMAFGDGALWRWLNVNEVVRVGSLW